MPLPLLALAAIGSAASGFATLAGGYQQAKAAKAQQLGAQIEASMARLRGTQIGERSREDLSRAQGNIDVVRTARGASLDSQTGQAIERRTRRDVYRDEAVAILGERNRAASADQAARGFGTAARWAMPVAVLNSVSSFASAASYGSAARGR